MAPQLITTIAEVTAQVPVNLTSEFDVVAPFLRSAEVSYVQRVIGTDQFAALVALYAAGAEPAANENQKEAISLCQKVISNIGYYFATPVLSVSIGSSGITVISNEQTKQAFQWQVNDLKDALISLGFNALEELLNLLEENPGDFAPYAGSAEFAALSGLLIQTAADFSDQYDIKNSRLVFTSIAYIIRRIENQNLVKLLGQPFLDSLKIAGLSEQKLTLLNTYIKPGLALIAVAKALTERVITLENGLVTYNFKGRDNNMSQSQPATPQQIAAQATQLTADGEEFLQDGVQYMLDNPSLFDDYTVPTPRRRFQFVNQRTRGIFGV